MARLPQRHFRFEVVPKKLSTITEARFAHFWRGSHEFEVSEKFLLPFFYYLRYDFVCFRCYRGILPQLWTVSLVSKISELIAMCRYFIVCIFITLKRHFKSLEFALIFNLNLVTNRMELTFVSVGNIYKNSGETPIGITKGEFLALF